MCSYPGGLEGGVDWAQAQHHPPQEGRHPGDQAQPAQEHQDQATGDQDQAAATSADQDDCQVVKERESHCCCSVLVETKKIAGFVMLFVPSTIYSANKQKIKKIYLLNFCVWPKPIKI